MFPDFDPPRVITYLKEEEVNVGGPATTDAAQENSQGSSDSDEDSGVP